MDRKAKEKFWARHVRAFEASGQSRTGYCKRHDLSVRILDYWRRRLAAQLGAESFVPLRVRSPTPRDAALVLECGGAQLKLPPDCDPVWLARLLSGFGRC